MRICFAVAAFVLLVAGICIGMRRSHAGLRASTHASAPAVSSTPSPNDTADLIAVDLRNRLAPPFALRDISGAKISLSQYKGHATVVNFWATYCEPCMVEMPWLQQLQEKYRDSGLVVLGINQDHGTSLQTIASAAGRTGVRYRILLPDAHVAQRYGGVQYLPETFYITRDGKVLLQTAGESTRDALETNIRATLAFGA